MRFPFLRSLILSCLFLLAARPGGFFDSASAASVPPGDACFTNEIALNDSTSDGNLAFDGAREYNWDAERGDQIGSLLDGGEAGARRASHATTRMASQHRLLEIKMRTGFETVGAIFPSFRQQMDYDDLGRRIRSRLYHRINLVEALVRDDVFVYDGWKLITTLSGQSGDVLQRFAWGLDLSHTVGGAGNVAGLLVFEDTALGQSHFPRFDGNGNVIGLIAATDSTGAPAGTPNAGEVSATYEYDPFGNALGATGHAAARNPFRFSTTYQDPVTGFSYYGYRFYDPGHGRWLNRDPIAEAGGLNLYGFVGNDPVNAVDVLGMATISDYESIISGLQSQSVVEHEKQLREGNIVLLPGGNSFRYPEAVGRLRHYHTEIEEAQEKIDRIIWATNFYNNITGSALDYSEVDDACPDDLYVGSLALEEIGNAFEIHDRIQAGKIGVAIGGIASIVWGRNPLNYLRRSPQSVSAKGAVRRGQGTNFVLPFLTNTDGHRCASLSPIGTRAVRRGQGTNSVLPFLTNTDGHRCASLSPIGTRK